MEPMTYKDKCQAGDYAILVPGLLSPSFILKSIGSDLNAKGLKTLIFNYTTIGNTIQFLSAKLKEFIQTSCQAPNVKIHLIGHSLGAIIIRDYLANNIPDNLGRVIMIAPPNKGSIWCNYLLKFKLIRLFFKPLLTQLKQDKESYVNKISKEINYQLGIIAGKSAMKILKLFMSEESDGLVSVDSTKLENASEFIIMNLGHLEIILSKKTLYQIDKFLFTGHFDHHHC